MTPSQAYAQWKQYAADPADSEAQSIQKFSQQFGIAPEQEEELYKAYPDQPIFRAPRKSGFLSQTFGAGVDELQKSLGSAIAGPGAETLADFGWEGGAGFLEDVGSDIVKQQEIDLQEYEAPQTREELIKEGGVLGSLYENVFSPVLQTPQQMGRQALPSLGAAGVALGAAGVAALASGGNPFIVGATAMAVGNAVGSFQVGGEEFETAKRDPFIRKQLGIDPNADFADLTPDQQRDLTDSAQRIAKETMVERLYQGGALESLAFIPYGPLALRYLADIALGATSEEMDKRLGMQNTLEELERLGVPREEIPELREKMKGLRPGTMETMLNAAVMEATFGSPTAIIETIAQPDSRVDRRATAESEKRKILKQRIKEAQTDPFKIEMAEKKLADQDVTTQIKLQKESDRRRDRRNKEIDDARQRVETRRKEVMAELDRRTGEDSMGRPFESSGVNGIPDTVWKKYRDGDPEAIDAFFRQELEQVTARAEANANEEAGKPSKTSSFTRTESKKNDIDDTGINEALNDVQSGKAIDSREADPSERLISMDRIMQQIAIDEFNQAFPEINFRASTLIKDKDGEGAIVYEDEDGNLQRDYDWKQLEGFVEDRQINEGSENPYVFLTQSMYNNQGHLITDTKEALDRMVEVAFHESIGHAGLRRMLNAGEMIDAVRDENGNITNENEYQRWTGEDYNKFIDGFRNRHKKMIDRWMKGDGDTYSEETTFRQTEEFIARHFGEAGGKPVGFFDNMAILIREINPFIGNSLNQYQVAKQIQLVADKYATGIKGKAPKKKNILTGVELVSAISRAATEAGVEKEVETPTEIVLSRRQKAKKEKEALQLTATAGIGAMPTTTPTEADIKATEAAKKKEEKETKVFETAALKKQKEAQKVAATEAKETERAEKRAVTKKNIEDIKKSKNQKTSPKDLEKLAETGTPRIRMNVAKHPNTSDKTLAMLAKDEESEGVVNEALTAIERRENTKQREAAKKAKAVESKKKAVKQAAEQKKKDKADLAKAKKIVAEIEKIKAPKKKTQAQIERLITNRKKVKKLEKKLEASTKTKSKRSKKRKTSLPLTTLEATPLGMAIRKLLLGPEHRETEAHRGKTPIAPSEGESYFKIKKNSKGDPLLDKDGKIQGEWRNKKRKGVAHLSEAASTAYLPESQQKGMTLHVERKKGETDAQVKARHKRKIKGIYKKSIADKTDPGAPLTEETKGLSRIDTKALNYEGWAMGVTFVGDETLQFEANQRTQALFYDNRVNRSADEFAEIAILEEGIKKELQAIADNEKLLKEGFPAGAKGAVRATKRQIEASRIRIKSKEDKILGLRKRMGNNLEEAFKRVKNEVDQEALLMYFGIHEDHGNLTLEEIGEIMSRPEYVQSFKEKYPDGKIKERLSYKNIFDAIGRALKQMSGNPDVKSEDYLPLAQYYHEVKGVGYDPKTGLFEGGKIQKQLTKREEGKSTLEIKKMVSELYPPGTAFTLENGKELKTKGGRLSPRYVKGSKELKAERLAAIQELYKKHKVVVKPDLKTHESTRKWGVSRKDMDWAKKNDYPPYAREGKIVKEKKVIKDEEQIEFRSKEGKEAAKTIDALVENNLDYYIKNPEKLSDLSPGMLDLVAERASKEGIEFGGKTKSKRTFIPNVPKDIKYNKLQRWVYALLGPTEKALDYTRKSLGRTAKKYQEASPKNSHSKYVLPNGNIFYIGKNKTTDNWIEQVESVLNDKEIMSAKRWYPTVKPAFEKAFGKEEAPKMMLAWALANKGESPLGAMKNILKVGQNLKKYLKAEYTKKGGLADANIIKVLKEDLITSGAGVKLYDFVDAAIGMKYRSVAGFDALMGAPAVVDRHTWRDFGFIDNALLNHLKKALPDNKKLKSIKLDRQDPSVTDTEYELAANWLRKMTDDLNARNWKGRSDWKPNEVQAVGWMGITTALGDVGGTPAQVIAETSRTLAFEIDFGEGSPFSKLFGKDFNEVISPEEKERITYLVGDLVADIALKKTGMKQTERIRGYGYYEDGGANPNVILKVSGTDPAMADIMNVIGLLAQQTDVIAFGPKAGARGVGFDFRDKNNKLKNKDTQDKLYEGLRKAFPNYVLGASQTTIKGKNGLRIVLDNAQAKKGKTVAETQQNVADLGRKIKREMWPVLKNLAQDLNLDLQLEMFQAETFYANNDWKENKNGERFIRGIDSRFRPSVSRRIVDNDTARIQRKIQTEIEKSKNKTAKAPEGKDLNVLETDVNPVFIRSVTTPNFRLQPVSKSRRSKPDISRSRHAAGADQRFGSRWTNFWLGQISKIRPLSKLSPESKEAYIKLRQVAFGQLAQWEHFSSSVYKALVDSKQSKEIYKYLTTPNANSSIISDPNERIHAEKAKRAIDKIGETLVSKKLMKETTLRDFKKKHGDYLPRVYLRHLLDENDRTAIARGLKPSNLEYLKQRRDIPKGVRELILGELTDQPGAPALLASRALMVPGKDLAIMNWMQKMKDLSIDKNLGWVIPNQFVSFNTLEEARAITKDLKISDAVMKKLELDVDFSDMSTEVTPAWLAAESAKLKIMAMDLQGDTKKIVTELYRRMSERAADMEPMFGEGVKIEGFTKLPNSARYGAMRGMWMHKQIADDIIGGMKMATGDESNWEKLVGETGKMGQYNAYWKWAKVAGNPPSWARNYISNNILLTLAGIPFWSIPGLNIAAAKEMLNKGKYYQIALKQGVMSGNMSHAELGKLETDFKRIQRKMQEDKNPLLWLQGGIGAVMEKTSNIYGGIETLGKIGAIKYAMEKKGMNESEAAAFANKWLFDYGLVTPSVRYASTAVVGAPFIRFQSHAIPLMLEVALTKPWRFLPYYALGYGMVELFKNNHDLDEEDFKAIKLALPEWLQEKAITPSIGSIPLLPPNILPLPSKDAQGRWVIHDVSYLMPWGMMSEVAGEVSKGRFGDAMKSLGLMGGPLADALVVLKTGVDPFTRRPITDDTKDWTSQAADYIKYMMNMSTPSMFHSSHGAAVRAYDSVVGNLDPKTGELKYEPWQALPRLFGQNLYATNLVEQRRTNMRRMKWEMGNLKAAWTRQLRGLMRSKAPREEIQEAREEYMELLKEKREELREYTKKSRVPASLRAG